MHRGSNAGPSVEKVFQSLQNRNHTTRPCTRSYKYNPTKGSTYADSVGSLATRRSPICICNSPPQHLILSDLSQRVSFILLQLNSLNVSSRSAYITNSTVSYRVKSKIILISIRHTRRTPNNNTD